MYHSRDIDDLRGDVAANCRVFLELCKNAGLQALVTETVRDEEYQLDCWKKGFSQQCRQLSVKGRAFCGHRSACYGELCVEKNALV